MNKTWSEQQNSIFGWFDGSAADAKRNLVVVARAGTGKTTTILEGVNRATEAAILVAAFNKKIADELVARMENKNATAKTLHAIGFSIVMKYWDLGRNAVARGSERKDSLTEAVCGTRVPDTLKKLVTKLHTISREVAPLATGPADLIDLAERFECEPDAEWTAEGWTVEEIASYAYKAMELAAAKKPATGIDFADMIFLPIRNKWIAPKYDLVVIDEAQDMTVAQLIIARGVCKPAGRVAVVGDDRQAIYAFRGADSESLSRLATELDATSRKLTITYRCGQAIVARAAALVPDFTAGSMNPEGVIETLPTAKLVETVSAGDFILSRVNAPLVSVAMSLLRSGKRTKIAGRDIGAGLKALVARLSKSAKSVPAFIERLEGWRDREIARASKYKNPDAKIAQVLDQAEMLASLADGVKNVSEISARIDALFTDDGLGDNGLIVCSSVHRSKGLEANRVFILAETLRNDTKEEENIEYVAITRAKTTLVFVSEHVAAAAA